MKTRLSSDSWIFTKPTAHRGLHSETVPENSFSAFELAVQKGYPIEMDVQMTSDKKLVVFHDDNPKRMTGVDTDIRLTDYATVKSWKLGNSEEIIPDFSDFLNFINGKVPLLIEIKSQKQEGISELVCEQLASYKGEFAIQSFDPRIMKNIKKLRPDFIRGILGSAEKNNRGWATDFALKWLPFNHSIQPDFINYKLQNLPICKLKSNNLPIICWTVRSNEDKALAEKLALNYVFEHIEP